MNREYIKLPIAELKPYGNNPRLNDNAVSAVMESIRQCEYITPIVVDENNCILAGHTRQKAMLYLNIEEEYVLRVSGLTDEQKRKFRLLDNRTNEYAFWDPEKLLTELDGLNFGDFDFGFDGILEDMSNIMGLEEEPKQQKKPKKGHTLKFGVRTVEISERDLNMLYDLYDQYVEAYGTAADFASWLVLKPH